MALAINDDHAAQKLAFNESPEWQRNPEGLRDHLTRHEVSALAQEPVDPQIFDKGVPSAAHTLVCRLVDHLPYYRLE